MNYIIKRKQDGRFCVVHIKSVSLNVSIFSFYLMTTIYYKCVNVRGFRKTKLLTHADKVISMQYYFLCVQCLCSSYLQIPSEPLMRCLKPGSEGANKFGLVRWCVHWHAAFVKEQRKRQTELHERELRSPFRQRQISTSPFQSLLSRSARPAWWRHVSCSSGGKYRKYRQCSGRSSTSDL